MPDVSQMSNSDLLQEYAQGSEAAFTELVQRQVNLVYSAALRQVGNGAQAEEIVQAVFIILARKAAGLRPNTVLEAWLYETTRLTALSFLRSERRRQFREQEAYMQSTLNEESASDATWNQIAPLLDEAVAHLGKKDREAVVLRFFKEKNLRDVAAALNVTEAAAQSRVHRALEKLHRYFSKRGVSSTTAIIAGQMSSRSLQAAPVGLAKAVSAVALTKGVAVSTSTLTLIKGALKLMAWTQAKTVVVIGVGVLLTVGTTAIVATKIEKARPTGAAALYEQIWAHPNSDSVPLIEKAPPAIIIRPTRYPDNGGGIWAPDGKGVWVNGDVSSLVDIAYNWGAQRTIFPDNLPSGNYDMIETLPSGQNTPALKAEIEKQFGVTAHTEIRNTKVLLLAVAEAAKLGAHRASGRNAQIYMTGNRQTQNLYMKAVPLSGITSALEGYILSPLEAQADWPGHYDLSFQWPTRLGTSHEREAFLRDKLSQFGLVLIATNMPIEMLIVEKAQ